MKYIIVDDVFPILFTEALKHSDFKYAFEGRITSAGMCKINNNEVHCYGESESLKLKPGPNDALRIKSNVLGWRDIY